MKICYDDNVHKCIWADDDILLQPQLLSPQSLTTKPQLNKTISFWGHVSHHALNFSYDINIGYLLLHKRPTQNSVTYNSNNIFLQLIHLCIGWGSGDLEWYHLISVWFSCATGGGLVFGLGWAWLVKLSCGSSAPFVSHFLPTTSRLFWAYPSLCDNSMTSKH